MISKLAKRVKMEWHGVACDGKHVVQDFGVPTWYITDDYATARTHRRFLMLNDVTYTRKITISITLVDCETHEMKTRPVPLPLDLHELLVAPFSPVSASLTNAATWWSADDGTVELKGDTTELLRSFECTLFPSLAHAHQRFASAKQLNMHSFVIPRLYVYRSASDCPVCTGNVTVDQPMSIGSAISSSTAESVLADYDSISSCSTPPPPVGPPPPPSRPPTAFVVPPRSSAPPPPPTPIFRAVVPALPIHMMFNQLPSRTDFSQI